MSLSVVCMPLGVDDSETISCTILPSNIRDVVLLAAYGVLYMEEFKLCK